MTPRFSNGRFHKDLRYLYPLHWLLVTTVALQLGLGIPSGATYELFFGTTTAKAQVGEVVNDAMLADTAKTTTISPTPAPTPELKLVATPASTPRPGSKQEIIAYIVEKFGDDSADMITIIRKCENPRFDQSAVNHNRNGTTDHGIAQINSIHIPRCGADIKTDWKANIDCAYDIYQRAGNTFRPWTCSTEIGQKNYLGQ